MKKLLLIVGAASLLSASPASAYWWNGGIWSGDHGCNTKMKTTNRWYDLLAC